MLNVIRNDNYWRLVDVLDPDPTSVEHDPARYLLVEQAHGCRTSRWFVTCEDTAAIDAYLRAEHDPWERVITEVHDLDRGERLSFELEMHMHLRDALTRHAACPFCSAIATLYPLTDHEGKVWWACKNALGLACFDAWACMVATPPIIKQSDF